VPSPKPPNVITYLDQADVARLVDACQGARERAVIMVFLDAGLRIAEAARLKVTDVCVDNLSARRLMVTGKGDKTRGVVIGMETASALRKYLRERSKSRYADSDALWIGRKGPMTISGLDQLIRKIGKRAGIKEIHPHLLRHTWAHHYRLNGGQTDNLVHLAGWANVTMALRYGRSAAAERAGQEARGLSLIDLTGGRRG
jgi:site-specific recombinase XerD